MSVEDNKNLIRKYIEEVINTGNTDEIEKLVLSLILLDELHPPR